MPDRAEELRAAAKRSMIFHLMTAGTLPMFYLQAINSVDYIESPVFHTLRIVGVSGVALGLFICVLLSAQQLRKLTQPE